MAPIRRTTLAFSLVAMAAVLCGNLQAWDNTAESGERHHCEKACPPTCEVAPKQPCAVRPIWCPDDYSRKCPPCICPPTYCGPAACYDAKCPPRICPPKFCGTCDSYDAKCPPSLKIPCFFPSFYKCPLPKCFGTSTPLPAITK